LTRQRAGVAHVVKQTVLGADPEATMAFGRWHGQIEQYLDQSGLAYTLVRPHSFMQNFLLSAQPVAEQGVLYGMTGAGRTSYSDTRDIAAVAAQVLTSPGHEGQRYTVTGPEALSAAEVAERLSAAIGRPVRYVDLPAAAFAQGLAGAGMPGWLVDRRPAVLAGGGEGAADLSWRRSVPEEGPGNDRAASKASPAGR
jgi:uncharacterized protein YbjT (DUF2867 family)